MSFNFQNNMGENLAQETQLYYQGNNQQYNLINENDICNNNLLVQDINQNEMINFNQEFFQSENQLEMAQYTQPSCFKLNNDNEYIKSSKQFWKDQIIQEDHYSMGNEDRFIPSRKMTNNQISSYYLSMKENNMKLSNVQQDTNAENNSNNNNTNNNNSNNNGQILNQNQQDNQDNNNQQQQSQQQSNSSFCKLMQDTIFSSQTGYNSEYSNHSMFSNPSNSNPDNVSDMSQFRVMKYKNKQQQPQSFQDSLSETYFKAARNVERKPGTRYISPTPEKILDAPELKDDYYLNLMDWGDNGILAVCLNRSVYLWNSHNGEIQLLLSTNSEDNYISSVSWMHQKKDILAIGFANNTIQLWDTEKFQPYRNMLGHRQRVSSLSWNNYILSSGSRDTTIINHDVRAPQSIISRFQGHQQEVCGLKWSCDGTQLASGSNDNNLMVWDLSMNKPQYTFTDHKAAVKAIAWCPWQRNLLVSGGGTADKTMKFWNTENGTLINSINVGSQVCSLVWAKYDKELVSSHGYSKNQLCVWKYPTMQKITELQGHQNRVLHMSLSPDGSTICSAATDESLRFWKVFETPSNDKNSRINNENQSNLTAIRQNNSIGLR